MARSAYKIVFFWSVLFVFVEFPLSSLCSLVCVLRDGRLNFLYVPEIVAAIAVEIALSLPSLRIMKDFDGF